MRVPLKPPHRGSQLLPTSRFGNGQTKSRRVAGLAASVAFAFCLLTIALLARVPGTVQAANPDGSLRIEINTAYNLVVDSNVETPATYAPESFLVGADICNDGGSTLTDVVASIGDFDEGGSNHQPGVYPSRSHGTLVGTFSLTHEGGTGDAVRNIGTLPAGECLMQYWLVSYPRLDDNGNAVHGPSVKPDDDLWLQYDVWATATEGVTPRTANQTSTVTMRNEISAMANKIWPNGDNKVPDAYKDAINEFLGWDNSTTGGAPSAYPGELLTTKGIWYDLGNVGHGFDNDGDFVPDQNAWLQPIGDPDLFDTSCFRLVHTYGILIVKLKGGGELLIPFEDQLYFENIPDNTGVVGLVFYDFISLGGACTSTITPYQEVASGFDNEKFNADYGHFMPALTSLAPGVTFDKSVDKTQIGPTYPETLTYTLAFTNSGSTNAGNLTYNVPLVVEDTIPSGTTYVGGSASSTIAAGAVTATVYYSTDNGQSWSATEPGDPTTVTDLQWWLNDTLAPGQAGTATFQVTVPTSYPQVVVPNTGGLNFGGSTPFVEDTVYTFLQGSNSIGDLVWQDEDFNGTTNGGTESGIDNILLTLYWDRNGDGELDSGDIQVATQSTSGGGSYTFSNLPDGDFLVVVDSGDTDLPNGYKPSTAESISIIGLSGTYVDADFGFGPPLAFDKRLVTNPVYEGRDVVYNIDVTNNRASSVGAPCNLTMWATATASQTDGGWINSTNAVGIGGPNSTFAVSDFQTGSETLGGTSFVPGSQSAAITKVEALYSIYIDGALVDDIVTLELYFNNDATPIASNTYNNTDINPYGPTISAQGLLTWDVTSAKTWNWADFTGNLDLVLVTDKINADDTVNMYVDNIGFRVTTNETCAGDLGNIMSTVPLTDTFDADRLQFVSAEPVNTSLSYTASPYTNTGVINWDNVGPIDGQETKTITVTFRALQPPGNVNTTITNTANIANVLFLDGSPGNDASDAVTTTLNATGSIAGVLWSEAPGGTTGWVGTTGYESGTDYFIPNATVNLYGCTNGSGIALDPTSVSSSQDCVANGGTWELLDSETTDSNGAYLFTGLINGFYYVLVDTGTLPGTVTQSAEAGDADNDQSGTGRTCGTCDHQWGDTSARLQSANFNSIDAASEDITNVNFGYNVNPAISGNVWEDFDGDGIRELGDTGIMTATVNLTGSNGADVTVNVDSNGDYEFTNLTAGVTYTITVITGSLPGTDTWTQTAETDTTINNSIVLTPTGGEILTGNDFGFTQSGSAAIGDTLYFDWDSDGSQDSGEEGIKDITVNLYADLNENGLYDAGSEPFIASTSTNSAGVYGFSGLAAGDYVVVVDITDSDFPANVNMTADPDESGSCTSCDHQGASTDLASGTTDNSVDFGYVPFGNANLGDTVFFDANGDGTQSGAGETGIANVTVQLWTDDNGDGTYSVARTTSTDSSGNYSFSGLPDGTYRVQVAPNDSTINSLNYMVSTTSVFTAVVSGGDVTTLNGTSCSSCNLDADFGYMPLGSIGDFVFWDNNGNAEPDYADSGISGVTVTLTNTSIITDVDGTVYAIGTYISTTTTSDGSDGNPIGFYRFTDLVSGTYSVSVDSSLAPISGASQTADPDRDGVACADNTYPSMSACDDATTVTILPGTNYMGADFGYQPTGVIGDFIWYDQDGDGLQDDDEIGIASVVITITNGVSTYTTTTDYNGDYSFSNLADDTWTVTVQQPAGMTTTSGAESIGTLSTDVVLSGGSVISIGGSGCSNCDLDIDLGFQINGPYSLTGNICLEDTGTTSNVGGCDVGDTNVSGYAVNLYNDDNDYIGSTTTSSSGVYTFTNLITDTYYIAIANSTTPLNNTSLTTTAANTPANSSNPGTTITAVTNNSASDYQTAVVSAVTAGGDNLVIDVDFAYESTVDYDFGDLPNSYNVTVLNDDGPRHSQPATQTLYLGSAPDSELNGQPDTNANIDSDEGVTTNMALWSEGANGGTVTVTVTGSGYLVGWFDFNNDGDFLDSGETAISQSVSTGTNQSITFDVPAGFCSGDCNAATLNLYARFRLFEDAPAIDTFAFSGSAENGEVEDYRFSSAPTAISLSTITMGNSDLAVSQVFSWLGIIALFTLISLYVVGRRAHKLRRHQA